ncbi:non-classical arabinogalactan protein 30 [Cucurbita moschata]|uniref:Non-classical arabinogalactan protein 30 n=1 Tax=Cucurbita moschata TaxID=3662 RepID=A0A6J1FS98_CUCMO|nr:non-classical arabinogalactan protein 30 [Cucurbita moschata]
MSQFLQIYKSHLHFQFPFTPSSRTQKPHKENTKMEAKSLLSLSLLLLLLHIAAANPPRPTPKPVAIAVEGMVYCQNCQKIGSWSLTGAKPIAGAKISVICKNHNNQVSFYKVYETNKYGYFYAELVGYKMPHPVLDHPLQACKVKPISSPLSDCDLLTNLNYGIAGAPLRYDKKFVVGPKYRAAVYSAGPLAFHPEKCL